MRLFRALGLFFRAMKTGKWPEEIPEKSFIGADGNGNKYFVEYSKEGKQLGYPIKKF